MWTDLNTALSGGSSHVWEHTATKAGRIASIDTWRSVELHVSLDFHLREETGCQW